jgi:16S rRNA (guanine966-N2)-methyltransferase
MFNSLISLDAITEARVLDLYAGSGALGIEALSRGAQHVVFVDHGRGARKAIEENLATTGYSSRSCIETVDAMVFLTRHNEESVERFDLVILDPPYSLEDQEWIELLVAVARVGADAYIVIESDRSVALPDGWNALREKKYGGTLVTIIQPPSLELPSDPSEPS